MRIDIGPGSGNKLVVLDLVHQGKTQEWNIDTYKRTTPEDVYSVFDNINGYFQSLPEETQENIFQGYRDIAQAMDDISDPLTLHTTLQKRIGLLYRYIDYENLKKWIRLHGHIGVPDDLKQDYSDVGNELTRRLTYLQDDYYDLSVLSTFLKPAVPIFGEYIRRMAKELGKEFKEHFAFSLMNKTGFIELKPFHRLRDYVEAKALNEERKNPSEYRRNSAVFGGLGTEELPDWLLSRVVVRRIAIHEESTELSIIASVFNGLQQQLNGLDKTFGPSGKRVNEKRLFAGGGEEDNVSVAENYKVKQEISDGELAILSIYTEEMYDMASRVDPTFSKGNVQLCAATAERNDQIPIHQHHITLTQWVVSKAISPRGIPSLNKPALLRAIAVTQGLLWHWGFNELALLMLAEPSRNASVAVGATTTRLNKRYMDQFGELYPHYEPVSKSAHNLRNVNVACKAVDRIAGELVQNDWFPHGPVELMEQMGMKNNDVHIISAEIRHVLGDLLLKLYDLRTPIETRI